MQQNTIWQNAMFTGLLCGINFFSLCIFMCFWKKELWTALLKCAKQINFIDWLIDYFISSSRFSTRQINKQKDIGMMMFIFWAILESKSACIFNNGSGRSGWSNSVCVGHLKTQTRSAQLFSLRSGARFSVARAISGKLHKCRTDTLHMSREKV